MRTTTSVSVLLSAYSHKLVSSSIFLDDLQVMVRHGKPGGGFVPQLVGYELEDEELGSPTSPMSPQDEFVPNVGAIQAIPLPGELWVSVEESESVQFGRSQGKIFPIFLVFQTI